MVYFRKFIQTNYVKKILYLHIKLLALANENTIKNEKLYYTR